MKNGQGGCRILDQYDPQVLLSPGTPLDNAEEICAKYALASIPSDRGA